MFKLKGQRGWVLIDSLLGIVIVSTALVALVLAYTQATKSTLNTTNRTQAIYIAQQTLDNLKKQDGGQGRINTAVTSPVTVGKVNYTIEVNTLNAPAGAAYTDNKNAGQYNLQSYQVTVSWLDGGATTNNVKMVGYGYYVVQ